MMRMNKVFKLTLLVILVGAVSACGLMPSVDGVFVDQRETYKKAHELPPLELPPELKAGAIQDEYDGGTKTATAYSSNNKAVVKTTPLSEDLPPVELIKQGVDSHLMVRDSLRNTWRKTISALEEKNYDIEDKNRQTGLVYLNIAKDKGSSSMLSSLAFWKSADTEVYLIELKRTDSGVTLRVLDEEETRIENEVSQTLLSDLLTHLAQ